MIRESSSSDCDALIVDRSDRRAGEIGEQGTGPYSWRN
jgi:hypothetical protein